MRSILNNTIGKVFADNGREKLIAEIEELLLCDFFDAAYRDSVHAKIESIDDIAALKNLAESVRLSAGCFEHIEGMLANVYITKEERAKYHEKCKLANNEKLAKYVVIMELTHRLLERIHTMRPKEIDANYRARMSQKVRNASLLFKLNVLQEIENKVAKTSALIGTMNQLYHDKCLDSHAIADILERLNNADIDQAEFSEIESRLNSKTWGQRFDTASNVAGGAMQVAEVASGFLPTSMAERVIVTAIKETKEAIVATSKNKKESKDEP